MSNRINSRSFFVFATGFLLLFNPQMAFAQHEDVRVAIEARNKELAAALNRADAAGMAALYTSAAQVFPANSDIVRGKEAIQKFWQGAIDSGIKAVMLKTLEAEAHGETAIEVGTYSMTGEGGAVLDTGKYLVVWKLEKGVWKLHRDIWNTSTPKPAK